MKASHLFRGTSLRWASVLMLSLGLCATPRAAEPEWPMSDEAVAIFKSGWAAARVGDQAGLMAAKGELESRFPATPITPYLEFEALRQQADTLDEETITRFLAKHRHWSFASALDLNWLRALGSTHQYAVMERYLAQTNQVPVDETVRCYRARGRVLDKPTPGSDAHQWLMEEAQSLWLVGYSQDKACDGVFVWWRSQAGPDATVAWSRFLLAIKNGERGLASYLQRYLEADQRVWSSRWLQMQRFPHRALSEARRWQDGPLARELLEWGLVRFARQNWAEARGYWTVLFSRFAFDESAKTRIDREIALFQAVSLDLGAIEAINQLSLSGQDAQVLAWQARVAMAHGRWDAVLESIERMPAEVQREERWLYWRGRALAELRRPDAVLAYAEVSEQANYYGFLAAQKLGQPLSLCPEPVVMDQVMVATMTQDPEFVRALALYQVGLHDHARWTWYRWLTSLPKDRQHQAALMASQLGWHDRAVATFAHVGTLRAYTQRFPLVFEDHVFSATERFNVDPALVYGLMRAESALQVDAHSRVGARGLLQLMPSTARAVARRQGQRLDSVDDLWDAKINVNLGVAHLAELEARFAGDWVKVAAAYNAGASAVDRWLNRDELKDELPADVWIETLPFYETRDYVPRVLAFATIYEWQLERTPTVLATHLMPNASPTPQAFACTLSSD